MDRAENRGRERLAPAEWLLRKVIDWLLRKGERGGFKPAQVKISTASPVYDVFIAPQGNRTGYPVRAAGSTQVGQTSDHKLTFYGVEFEGYLVVTDASKFVTTLQDGVGSGKAFGYGLLSIAPEHAQD